MRTCSTAAAWAAACRLAALLAWGAAAGASSIEAQGAPAPRGVPPRPGAPRADSATGTAPAPDDAQSQTDRSIDSLRAVLAGRDPRMAERGATVAPATAPTGGTPGRRERRRPRGVLADGAFGLTVGQPLGAFDRHVGIGVGVGGAAVLRTSRVPLLGLRTEGGVQNYGRQVQDVPLRGVFGFQQWGRMTTSNDINWAGVGPQLTLPLGPVRPYAFATAGFSNFATTSTFESADARREFLGSTTNLSSWTLAQGYGGGVQLRLPAALGGLAVDLGARRHRNREVRYLREGAAVLVGPGRPQLDVLRGRADLVTYFVGVRAGAR